MSHVVFVELSDVDVVAPVVLCLHLFGGDLLAPMNCLFGRPRASRGHHQFAAIQSALSLSLDRLR